MVSWFNYCNCCDFLWLIDGDWDENKLISPSNDMTGTNDFCIEAMCANLVHLYVGAQCALSLEFNECGFWHTKPFVSRSEHCLLPFTKVFKCQQRQLMNRVVLMNFSKCSKEGHFTPFRVISYSHISEPCLVMV